MKTPQLLALIGIAILSVLGTAAQAATRRRTGINKNTGKTRYSIYVLPLLQYYRYKIQKTKSVILILSW